MRGCSCVAMVFMLSTGWALPPIAPGEGERAKVEIRRCETKPAEGLVEAEVVGSKTKVYLHKTAELTNEDIAGANVVEKKDVKEPAIEIVFTKKGHEKAEKLSKEHKGKPIAILIDGKVVAAPAVKSTLEQKVLITGAFTKAEAERIVKSLRGP